MCKTVSRHSGALHYIGIIALARYLVLDMKSLEEWRILAIAAAILVLALAVLVLRYGHTRFPYPPMRRKKPGPTSEEP